jgi:uncharacterized membrane protein YjfL (UPF0719 family)
MSALPVLGLVVKMAELLPVLVTTRIVVLVSPFSVKKEIEEDQNTALAIMIGALILGISIIIASAING